MTHRLLALIHRYVGMTIGVLMAMWCVSGIVMMYVAYPDLPESRRVAALPPLNTTHCCTLPATVLPEDRAVASFQIEMLATRPVLRFSGEFAPVVRSTDLVGPNSPEKRSTGRVANISI